MDRCLFVITVCLICSVLSGCSVDPTWPDLEKEILSYIKPLGRHEDSYKPPATAAFSADKYRSPFEPLREPPAGPQDNPLLAWPLSSLQFTGTVVSSHGITGFIMTPDNKLYEVKEGDQLGNRKGQIISIDSGKIIVRDASQGHAAENTVTLRLKGAD